MPDSNAQGACPSCQHCEVLLITGERNRCTGKSGKSLRKGVRLKRGIRDPEEGSEEAEREGINIKRAPIQRGP